MPFVYTQNGYYSSWRKNANTENVKDQIAVGNAQDEFKTSNKKPIIF